MLAFLIFKCTKGKKRPVHFEWIRQDLIRIWMIGFHTHFFGVVFLKRKRKYSRKSFLTNKNLARWQAEQIDLFNLLRRSGVFTQAAADEMVDNQGLTSLFELGELKDDEVEGLCNNVRRPGGLINLGTSVAPNMRTAGIPIGFIGAQKLKAWANAVRQRQLCGRTTTSADLTADETKRWREFTDKDEKYVEPKHPPSTKDVGKNWPRPFEALEDFFKSVRSEKTTRWPTSKEQLGKKFRSQLRDAGVRIKQIEPYTEHSNRAELSIRELKKSTRRKMVATKSPKRLWDDCMELEAEIMSHTADENYYLQGQVPQFMVTG
jgi:hypothetical protein